MALFVVTFVFVAGVVGLVWAIYNYKQLSDVELTSDDKPYNQH